MKIKRFELLSENLKMHQMHQKMKSLVIDIEDTIVIQVQEVTQDCIVISTDGIKSI